MTKEQRILFELSDLKSMRLVCKQCEGEVVYPISGRRVYPPDRCPHCQELLGFMRGTDPAGKFILAMHDIIANDDNLKVQLKFEMEDESG